MAPPRLHLPDGRPAPDAAPPEAILDPEDLATMRRALVEGHSVSLGSNGAVYVHRDLDGAWTSRTGEFIESKLGDMKQLLERGFSVKINPTGVIDARSADGRFRYHSDRHPDPTGTEREYIREAIKSGANVAIMPDGTIQVTQTAAPPLDYAQDVDMVMRRLDEEVNLGRLGAQAAEGKAFVITTDTTEPGFDYRTAPQSAPAIRFPDPLAPVAAAESAQLVDPFAEPDPDTSLALQDPFAPSDLPMSSDPDQSDPTLDDPVVGPTVGAGGGGPTPADPLATPAFEGGAPGQPSGPGFRAVDEWSAEPEPMEIAAVDVTAQGEQPWSAEEPEMAIESDPGAGNEIE